MILTLEVTGPQAAQLGAAGRKTFGVAGGVIGRDKSSDWVLPHTKVSGHHARITCVNAMFFVEDASRNGTFLNSTRNRLTPGRPHPLQSGDRLLIDPYEIEVSVSTDEDVPRPPSPQRSSPPYSPLPHAGFESQPFDEVDPFDPFSSPPPVSKGEPRFDPLLEAQPGEELDPLKLLDPNPVAPPPRQAPSARDLDRGSPLVAHYQPPAIISPPAPSTPPPPRGFALIPEDYDPLAPDPPEDMRETLPPPLIPSIPDVVERSWPPVAQPHVATPPTPSPPPPLPPPPTPPPAAAAPPLPPPIPLEEVDGPTLPPRRAPLPIARDDHGDSGLAAVLAGAGLEGVQVTPELARSFGEILQVVVSGVMDVLRARHQIKDEFRMRVTHFKPKENNPLKFSANVDDALHNLLVKRNEAYLGPVEAFDDAFDDLRDHQIALLAGMRVAFEFMLSEFDPERMQEHFDRQIKRGSVLGMPAKMRYWDLYREKYQETAKDPEASFRKLFGEAFAKAYEEQLRLLKGRRDDKQ